MSLRDEFEKLRGKRPNDDEAHFAIFGWDYASQWDVEFSVYQSATERALRIVREEDEKHDAFSPEGRILNLIERRLKGDS